MIQHTAGYNKLQNNVMSQALYPLDYGLAGKTTFIISFSIKQNSEPGSIYQLSKRKSQKFEEINVEAIKPATDKLCIQSIQQRCRWKSFKRVFQSFLT